MNGMGVVPEPFAEKFLFLFKCIFDPYIFSGFVAAFVASLCWMAAISKFDVSYAYPFTSGAFVIVLLLSALLFDEPLTTYKVLGLLLIVSGICLVSRSV
jgi:drug/metabolite transporter (DMT)-like permease|tara:strand:+ start:475 stop:771 length:297 start_codon:yes stop_codon:yes gene_type:complete